MTPLRTILLVEDSPLTRRMIRLMLEQHGGFVVEEAIDGQDALKRLATTRVDVVLSDLHMMPMDGQGLRESIRAQAELSHLPFIMMTAQHCPEAIHRTVVDQDSHYLAKPFSREQLFQTLERTVLRQAA
jgi:two-component system chemotaxis response regulator CheY